METCVLRLECRSVGFTRNSHASFRVAGFSEIWSSTLLDDEAVLYMPVGHREIVLTPCLR